MIHAALVAEQSAALQSLVNGAVKEAQAGRAEWEDVAVETFIAFAEYVYTGNYTLTCDNKEAETSQGVSTGDQKIPAPAEELVWGPNESIIDVNEGPFEGFASGFGMKKDKKPKKGRAVRPGHRSPFHDLVYPHSPILLHSTNTPKPLPSTPVVEDYASIFLMHARVYVFAEKWVIEPLKVIAFNKLHEALRNYTRYEARSSDIVELVKYTYDNTPSLNQRDPLRELVIQYIAYEGREIARSKECMDLIGQKGDFAKDLMGMVLEATS